MNNTPEIMTERLILRKFNENDVKPFFDFMRDEEVNLYLPLFPFATMEEAKKYLLEHYIDKYKKSISFKYAVCLKSDNIVIGYVNLSDDDSYDFGYGLQKEYWHKGIVTEACKAVIGQIKKSGIPYITATHDIKNQRSGNVMKKIGMTYQYSYEEQWQPKDILVTFRMYQLNFSKNNGNVYKKYWNKYPVHFIEENI
jgi:RimJ/RimL family protein N-acetyltransferase